MGYKMKKSIALLTMFSMVLVLSFLGCGQKKVSGNNNSANELIPVQTALVEKKDLNISKTFSGTLEGEEQANIVSKIPERVIGIRIKVGDYVSAGQLLVELDKSGASSQYYQAEAAFVNAERDMKRMEALFADGAVSRQMLDGVQTQYKVSKANFEAAKSIVELTTPISGVVTAVNANVGDLTQVGMPLVVVANINKMKIIFRVGEADVASLSSNQAIEVFSELKPSLIQSGRILQISKSAEVQSRSFEVKAIFNNTSDKWFKPGMFCRTKVNLNSQKGSLVIPNTAIIYEAERKAVYVIKNNIAAYRIIETGITDGLITEVLNGLNEGEVIATIGTNNLKESAAVHVAN